MELGSAGLELMVLDTRTPHALVDSEYATRRASCAEASRLLGIAALRDVTDLDSAMRGLPDPVMRRRLRHVVTENARVQDAAEAPAGRPVRRPRNAAQRLARLYAGRLRDHGAHGRPGRRDGDPSGGAGSADDRRRVRRVHSSR